MEKNNNNNFKVPSSKELKKLQDELVDTILTKPEELKKIINVQLQSRNGFYNYSLHNLILADYQLFMRTGEGIEILAPYKVWEEKGRQVKKGEKALRVLAPVFKKEKDKETGEEKEYLAYFMRVPVFDLSQTIGEPLEKDYTVNKTLIKFEDIRKRVKYPIFESNKQLTRASTDGKSIKISKHISDTQKICSLLHEIGHIYLHFDKNRNEITTPIKELEAEAISFIVSSYLGIDNHESGAYIINWAGENSLDLLKGKGKRIINTSMKIIKDLQLTDWIYSNNQEAVFQDASERGMGVIT